ncbi:MAG: flagellar motor stator protein MotA [Melioribacteraceae bacterium]|nr:flagellar motor stator protein MotA [Melioribacteraceae bacterium]MCF8355167.1 flagellar motor stator protein MotA [Melioribacteraceae bacterium]MCF8392496.1 flagellar motor stator protein MotA [Melioribacteraceae bacterium]MCF8418407.1 flagellar motor stator protein MotA [Melioribacteraceae bacterium]
MFIIIGALVVVGSLILGFTIAGGNLLVLLQWAEFLIIGGAAFGSMLISAPLHVLKKIAAAVPKAIAGSKDSKEENLKLLKSFYDLFLVAQRDGLLSLEQHIEKPEESEILKNNENFLNNTIAVTFFSDTLKVMLTGGVPPHEIESLMDIEIETFMEESRPISGIINKVGDSFPGLGIVAAVLGIIVTMNSIDQGAAYVGQHVAAALVGTFIGVLMAYGFVNPLATNIDHMIENEVRYLETIKACIVSYAKGNPPIVAVEIARRTIVSENRPTFTELENHLRGKNK